MHTVSTLKNGNYDQYKKILNLKAVVYGLRVFSTLKNTYDLYEDRFGEYMCSLLQRNSYDLYKDWIGVIDVFITSKKQL